MKASLEQKYGIAISALRRIAKYGHEPECTSSAPVHECGCCGTTEIEMAEAALKAIEGET